MTAPDAEPISLTDRIGEETRNLLLLAPSMDSCATDGCADLLTITSPSEEDVLYVTFLGSPDQHLDDWQRRFGNERPAKTGFVDVGESTRSAATASATVINDVPGGEITIRTVSSPGNLTDLGIQVSQYLSEWEGDGRRTVVCFDSLTTLLQYADVQRVFRFLHVLTGRVRSTGGFAHYHIDPTAHDPRTLNTLRILFDGTAEWEGGGWTVSNR